MPNPTCIFYTPSPSELSGYAERLEADGVLGMATVVASPAELFEAVTSQSPDLVVSDLGIDPEGVLELLSKLPAPRPALLVVGPQDHPGAILRSMRMGVREYFDTRPSEAELRYAIERFAAERVSEPEVSRSARVLAVMGAKGGAGATVVACQLAAGLQAMGARTAVVDLNLPLGDVALYFDVQPAYTLAHVAREDDRLDETYLRTVLQGPPDGVQLLAAPSHAEEAELVTGHHVERVLELLRSDFDWVIVDASRNWGEPTMRALDLADQILLVTLMDVPTLHHTRQHLDLLERLGHSGARIRLIANRHSAEDSVGDKDVVEFLDRELDYRIPNDYPTTSAAVNRGISVAEVAPRSPLSRAFEGLAQNVYDWCSAELPEATRSEGVLARAKRMWRRT